MKMADGLLLCSRNTAFVALKASLSQSNILLANFLTKRQTRFMLVTGLHVIRKVRCQIFGTGQDNHLLGLDFLSYDQRVLL